MEKVATVVLFAALVCSVFGGKLPVDFTICGANEANLNECLVNAVQDALIKLKDGNTELSLGSLDPLHIPSVTVGEGKGAVNVVQKYKNFDLHGVTSAQIKKIDSKLTADGWTADFDIFFPEVSFHADYDFNGRILLLPIVGQGKCVVTMINPKVTAKIVSHTHEKKGASYLKVDEFKLDFIPEKVTYSFENLFNGDKRLGEEMNKVLNENWLDVFADVKPGYVEVLQTAFASYANRIFAKIAFADLFPQKS